MSDLRRFRVLDLCLFAIVLLGAGTARVWYLGVCADAGSTDGLFRVQDPSPQALVAVEGEGPPTAVTQLESLVENLRETGQFAGVAPLGAKVEPTAYRAPGYPLVVALTGRFLGGAEQAARNVRWLQGGLGSLTAALYFLFARQAFQSRLVAILAGLLVAFHPFAVVSTTEIGDAVLASFLLALGLLLGSAAGQHGGVLASLLYGLVLAALALVRAALLPFALAAVVWFLFRCRLLRRGWLYALLAFLGFTNPLGLWAVRNYQACGDLFPVASSTYYHLWMGNNPLATGGPLPDGVLVQALAELRQEEAADTARRLAELPEKQRYAELARPVQETIRGDAAGFWQRRLRAAGCFLVGERWLTQGTLFDGPPADADLPPWLREWYPALFPLSLFSLLGLGALGWRWSYAWRYQAMPAALAVVWLPLPYIVSHAEALHGPRLPLDGVLLTLAAFTLACLLPTETGRLLAGPAGEGA